MRRLWYWLVDLADTPPGWAALAAFYAWAALTVLGLAGCGLATPTGATTTQATNPPTTYPAR